MRNVFLRCANVKRYMQFYIRLTLTIFFFVFFVSIYNNYSSPFARKETNKESELARAEDDEGNSRNSVVQFISKRETTNSLFDSVHLAVVACGERLEEPLMMLKSAVMLGSAPLHFHIFADDNLRMKFNESVKKPLFFVIVFFYFRSTNFLNFSYLDGKKFCDGEF